MLRQDDNLVHFMQFFKFGLISFIKETYGNFSKTVSKFVP
jgi:hypothetical protein